MAEQTNTETLTYRELAVRLGIGVKAAKARAKRHEDAGKWFRFRGNDGRTHVKVPVQDLETAEISPPPVADHAVGYVAGHVATHDPDNESAERAGWDAYRAATDGIIQDLRQRLDAAEQARDDAVADVRAALTEEATAKIEAAELRAALERERERADAAEQARDKARQAAAAQRDKAAATQRGKAAATQRDKAAEQRTKRPARARRGVLARIFQGSGGDT